MKLQYSDKSIYKLWEQKVSNHSELLAYTYFGKSKTYSQLINEIDQCSKSLVNIGVRKEDKVSIIMPNTPEGLISFYAINKIGAIANMIHPLSSTEEIKYYLKLSESKYVILFDKLIPKIKEIEPEITLNTVITVSAYNSMHKPLNILEKKYVQDNIYIKWNKFIKKGRKQKLPISKVNKDDCAVILYSGGTTGLSKGVELTNYNFNAVAIQSIEACQSLYPKDKTLSIMPIFHGFGLAVGIHTLQMTGTECILIPRLKDIGKLIKKHKPNIIIGVPTLYEAILNSEHLKHLDFSFLTLAISGGDTMSPDLKSRMEDFLKDHNSNLKIREGYGLTECVAASCLMPKFESKEGSIGKPYLDMKYKIVKPSTIEEVSNNETGEITICGPSVMKGYLKNQQETEMVIKTHKDGEKWLHTGDMGYIDEEGYLFFVSRIKRIIVSSGYNIYPQTIEKIVNSHELVISSCAIAIKHPSKVQVVKVFIKVEEQYETEKVKLEIKDLCEKKLSRYSWPQEYEFIKEMPKTKIGKLDFQKLEEK